MTKIHHAKQKKTKPHKIGEEPSKKRGGKGCCMKDNNIYIIPPP